MTRLRVFVSLKVNRYDVIAAHPLRHHYLHSLRGIEASGASLLAEMPMRVDPRMLSLIRLVAPRVSSTLAYYSFPGVAETCFERSSGSLVRPVMRRLLRSNIVERFDQTCARRISSGEISSRYLHVFQDYLPKTIAAARAGGSKIVVEQISNSSPASRALANKLVLEWGVPFATMGFAPSEESNDKILAMSSVAVCPSNFVIGGIRARFQGRIERIPYGVDTSAFKPGVKPPTDQEFRIVARANTLRKGLPIALGGLEKLCESLSGAARPKVIRMDFLGDMEGNVHLGEILAKLNRQPGVVVTSGRRSRLEVRQLLAAAHIFLMPAVSEGMSLAVMEGASCATALLLSGNCGIDDFQDGEDGFEIRDFTADGVKNALEKSIRLGEGIKAMGDRARRLARSRDWCDFERDIAALYRNLLKE